MAEPVPHWPGRMVGPVHVRSTPEGAPEQAVFVHGLAGSATNWTDLMQELKDEVTGHAIDLPGAGFSPEPPDGDYSVAANTAAVIGFLERICSAHQFGYSM
jgi:pimeloyl-ACP methyl ester carboxylesterase